MHPFGGFAGLIHPERRHKGTFTSTFFVVLQIHLIHSVLASHCNYVSGLKKLNDISTCCHHRSSGQLLRILEIDCFSDRCASDVSALTIQWVACHSSLTEKNWSLCILMINNSLESHRTQSQWSALSPCAPTAHFGLVLFFPFPGSDINPP